jgi:hypothetical protein
VALEEAMPQIESPVEEHPRRKISLSQQIEEIERELLHRRSEYPRLVSREKLRQAVADYQMERLEAARASLKWLQQNEGFVKWAIENRNAIKQKMKEAEV